ncbi:MAG: alpha-glucan family phosphorylase [Planctomycetota bacterium]
MESCDTRAATRNEEALPPGLRPLAELAFNLWWCWDAEACELFRSIDPGLWTATGHNPVMLLERLGGRRLRSLAADRDVVATARSAVSRMRTYLRARTWYKDHYGGKLKGQLAYFSMEFGLHESLPIFAGGLGVLAGDHFKSASDLGLPLVGVSIFWRRGYTRQRIDAKGKQVDVYDRLSPGDLPLTEARNRAGRAVRVKVPIGCATVVARAWRLAVGRTNILLLDTNLPENAPRDRKLTDRLYSGDRDTRIRQELVLGIGGWKLLRAMGLPVVACHLNEGHAAFCLLERLAETMHEGRCDLAEAKRCVSATTVFTAHTPIPEGNETFAPRLVDRYAATYAKRLGVSVGELLALGRVDPDDAHEDFGMTPLALRLSNHRNGVSKLHGEVSRKMWHGLWPNRRVERVPIGSITNGIHLRTWLHPRMGELLDRYLPEGWERAQDKTRVWAAAGRIPNAELWSIHLALKEELLDFVRARLRHQLRRHGAGERKINAAGARLSPRALTIGFARRFATYKRASLIFSDVGRFARIVNHAKRPVQIIFAGKAHPADTGGKAIVTAVARHAMSPRFKGRVVYLEDYDMDIARRLVAGVDVWLNTPERPREASGTSGMKPTLHGGLNLSILDGWWPEACIDGKNGWSIGAGKDHDGTKAADRRDALALYRRLERDVIPAYYTRDRKDRPTAWIRMMKRSLATIPAAFSSHRMVKEYMRRYYQPAMKRQ